MGRGDGGDPSPVDELARAIAARDWDRARALLHPYVRWTCADGPTIRGRTNVLAHLATQTAGLVPSDSELRDGQVYRWIDRSPGCYPPTGTVA